MEKLKHLGEVIATMIIVICSIWLLLFSLGIMVTDIEVTQSLWTACAFMIVAVAALNPILKAERVLKAILVIMMLWLFGKLYLPYFLDSYFATEDEETIYEVPCGEGTFEGCDG